MKTTYTHLRKNEANVINFDIYPVLQEIVESESANKQTIQDILHTGSELDQEVVVNSTSNFLVKNFERYLKLMNLDTSHSIEIFTGLVDTFEFFVSKTHSLQIIFEGLCSYKIFYTFKVQKRFIH